LVVALRVEVVMGRVVAGESISELVNTAISEESQNFEPFERERGRGEEEKGTNLSTMSFEA